MANGNEALYDSATESKYVRPYSAFLGLGFGFIFLMALVVFAVWCGFNGKEINMAVVGVISAASVACFVYPGWYFGIRKQDKQDARLFEVINKFADLIPKANGQAVPPSTPVVSPDGAVSPTGETEEDTGVTVAGTGGIVKIPFDIGAFMAEVDRTTLARYGFVNFSTTFYNAETVLRDWKFDNNDAVDTANKALLTLAGNAFKEIWGVSYEDANKYLNDPKGCTTCGTQTCTFPDLKFKARQLGMGYYTALLDYERVLDTIW